MGGMGVLLIFGLALVIIWAGWKTHRRPVLAFSVLIAAFAVLYGTAQLQTAKQIEGALHAKMDSVLLVLLGIFIVVAVYVSAAIHNVKKKSKMRWIGFAMIASPFVPAIVRSLVELIKTSI